MTLSVGNFGIDGLEDIEQIGTGGSSRVYRARQTDLDRVVAVKVLNPGYDQSVSKRFDRERKAMGRLSLHEGIVPVYSSGLTAHGEPYLVMPYYANGSLQDQIDTGAMEWQTAVSYVDVAAETIAVAHDEGVVHLDLKPANILLTNNGAPRIADFGIAKLTSGQGASAGTTTGAAFTPAYSAPETFLDGETGPPSDVYGLGATLWALLVGHPPFLTPGDDTNLMAVIGRVVNNAVGDLRHFTPSPICDVIERAMAKQPEDRFQTARDFSMALKQAGAASSPDFQPTPDIRGTALFPTAAVTGSARNGTQEAIPTQMLDQSSATNPAPAAVAGATSRPLLQETALPHNGSGPPPLVSAPAVEFDRFRSGPVMLGLVALIGVVSAGLLLLTGGDGNETRGTVEVPVSAPASPSLDSPPSTLDPAAGQGVDGSDGETTVTTPEPTDTLTTTSNTSEATTTVESTTSSTVDTTSSTTEATTSSTNATTTTTEAPTTTTEAPTTTLEPPTTTVAPTTAPSTTEPPTSVTTTPTGPPDITASATAAPTQLTISISSDQCITYRVSALDAGAADPRPVVVSSPAGGPCATSHSVAVSGLQPATSYTVTVIGTNANGDFDRFRFVRSTS